MASLYTPRGGNLGVNGSSSKSNHARDLMTGMKFCDTMEFSQKFLGATDNCQIIFKTIKNNRSFRHYVASKANEIFLDNICLKHTLTTFEQHQWRIYIVKFWTRAPPPPRGSKFFQFHAVFGKFWRNRMLAPPPGELAPPPRGNPRSATEHALQCNHFSIKA